MAIEDAYLRHQIHLEQFSNGRGRKMLDILEAMENNIIISLRKRKTTVFQRDRFISILRSVRGNLAAGYMRIADTMNSDLNKLADIEAKFNADVINSATDKTVNTINAERLLVATRRTAFQGKTMNVWLRTLEVDQAKQITNQVRQGWLLGETNGQIAARLTGNAESAGVFAIGKNNVSTITRSATNQMAAQARDLTFKANKDIIEAIEWVSTLDGRTTMEICAPRDGLLYTLNQEPIDHGYPWDGGPGSIHWQCRSVSVPKIKGQKDIERIGLDFNKETKSRAKSTIRYDKETRTAVGKGVRNPNAVRRGVGKTYAPKTTYRDWFAKQPAWFQKQYLGPNRYAEFKAGKYRIDKFDSKLIKPISSKTLKKVSVPKAQLNVHLNKK